MKINLDNFGEKTLKVLAGREKGAELRNKLSLDKLDKNQEQVEIMIPENLYSINSSYFLGLFGPSVRSLGEAGFNEKYIFISDDILKSNIEDGISRAIKESADFEGKNEKQKH